MRIRTSKCDECGADMTGEDGAAVEQAETKIGAVSYIIERRIAAISVLDDGKTHDLCQKCRIAALKEPLTKEFSAVQTSVMK